MKFQTTISSKREERFYKTIKYEGSVRELAYEERLQFVLCTQIDYLYMKICIARTICTTCTWNCGRPIKENIRIGHLKEGGWEARLSQLP